jgi:RNA polymerase sigma-70 factor, ECF subfamily
LKHCWKREGPAEEEQIAVSSRPTEQVQRILQALPETYRESLTCRFLPNLSIKETAVWMGLSEGNVKVLQLRARKRAADLDRAVLGSMESHPVV